jgi:hypothetical protein
MASIRRSSRLATKPSSSVQENQYEATIKSHLKCIRLTSTPMFICEKYVKLYDYLLQDDVMAFVKSNKDLSEFLYKTCLDNMFDSEERYVSGELKRKANELYHKFSVIDRDATYAPMTPSYSSVGARTPAFEPSTPAFHSSSVPYTPATPPFYATSFRPATPSYPTLEQIEKAEEERVLKQQKEAEEKKTWEERQKKLQEQREKILMEKEKEWKKMGVNRVFLSGQGHEYPYDDPDYPVRMRNIKWTLNLCFQNRKSSNVPCIIIQDKVEEAYNKIYSVSMTTCITVGFPEVLKKAKEVVYQQVEKMKAEEKAKKEASLVYRFKKMFV